MLNNDLNVIIGTGALGLAVMDELLSKEKKVYVINRSGSADVPNDVEVFMADVTDKASIRNVCKGASVIYHCAAPAYTEWAEKFPPLMDGIIDVAKHTNAT